MNLIRWAAVAVTGLFVLMNLGTALAEDQTTWIRIAGVTLAVVGAAAAAGLALDRTWGRPAVIGVGAANVVAAFIALLTDESGFVVGLVMGGLAVLLGALASTGADHKMAPAR
ncbi:hypothetical protein EKO23_20890 [Nocardioides guangzhouensis]|uniref:Uncharacterized protein n=1 Tax=Nocardioides guangzhouensis TaxID=2497878 RepID=A0A4V1XYD4_9ACTN|nr:hypothetical protein [Nocardioides guangzhouensis]RYP82859.1 hypothetical protein EKO23_20890 [Nocardioides guangzhouensis]